MPNKLWARRSKRKSCCFTSTLLADKFPLFPVFWRRKTAREKSGSLSRVWSGIHALRLSPPPRPAPLASQCGI